MSDPTSIEDEVFERTREGIVVLNSSLIPTLMNEAARKLLGFSSRSMPSRIGSDELESVARRSFSESRLVEAEITLWPRKAAISVLAQPLSDDRGVLLSLHDVTADVKLQQIRRQFVVNASHELKTPVSGLLALGEAVRDALPTDVMGAQRLADQLVREAERLTKLTQDLLDLSRVEDPASMSRTIVRIVDIVREQVMQLSALAAEQAVTIEMEVDGDDIAVTGDEQQVALMLRNLIDNAIRYSDRGNSVVVGVRQGDDEAIVEVIDTGIGIPMKDQARVFERFYRVDQGRSRASGGTGLGLSIVRHVAESHGGHVSLQSELGEGSRFTVRLPLPTNGAS